MSKMMNVIDEITSKMISEQQKTYSLDDGSVKEIYFDYYTDKDICLTNRMNSMRFLYDAEDLNPEIYAQIIKKIEAEKMWSKYSKYCYNRVQNNYTQSIVKEKLMSYVMPLFDNI